MRRAEDLEWRGGDDFRLLAQLLYAGGNESVLAMSSRESSYQGGPHGSLLDVPRRGYRSTPVFACTLTSSSTVNTKLRSQKRT